MEVARFDKGQVKGEAQITDEGYIKAHAVVTRTGVFLYKNPDGTLRRELRHPDEVLQADSLSTMKMIPVTNGHPAERLVTADNAKQLAIGFTGEQISQDNQYILANFLITDADGVRDVIENNKKELSLGYTVDLVPEIGDYFGEPYDYRQTNIKYNHLSLVSSARAGPEARIALDSEDAEEVNLTEAKEMTKRKIRIRGDDYMMEPDAAEGAEKLMEDLRNLEDEKRRVESEIARLREQLDKSSAETDSMKEKMGGMQEEIDRKMDSNEIKRGVKERLRLYKVAERCLDREACEKMDDLSDMEIKKAIIKSKSKNVSLDGKSDIYIQARYDSIVEDLPQHSEVKANPAYRVKPSRGDGVDSDEARDRMIAKFNKKS